MVTRTVVEAAIYVLRLNPMRCEFERIDIAAVSTDRDKLLNWYNEQLAPEMWVDSSLRKIDGHDYRKFFKAGSPLEWYNPIATHQHDLIRVEWVNMEDLDALFARYNTICRD